MPIEVRVGFSSGYASKNFFKLFVLKFDIEKIEKIEKGKKNSLLLKFRNTLSELKGD